MFNWYEEFLPQELERLGVKCEKIPVVSRRCPDAPETYAWKVVAGETQFRTRPLIAF